MICHTARGVEGCWNRATISFQDSVPGFFFNSLDSFVIRHGERFRLAGDSTKRKLFRIPLKRNSIPALVAEAATEGQGQSIFPQNPCRAVTEARTPGQ